LIPLKRGGITSLLALAKISSFLFIGYQELRATSILSTPLPFTSLTMAPSRTSTVKSKHATNKSGIRNSKTSTKPQSDGVSKSRKPKSKGPPPKPQKSAGNLAVLKKKRRVYTEKELGVPTLNMITPIGVEKPKGKKGKVFVDDRVSYVLLFEDLMWSADDCVYRRA
jgi:hypothetical protein